jgi:hypothetical protein
MKVSSAFHNNLRIISYLVLPEIGILYAWSHPEKPMEGFFRANFITVGTNKNYIV